MILDELPILKDHPRIVYTGLMNYQNYRMMLQRTNLHCYFTEPFVTSWSLFEAVACGTPVLCNASPATSGTIRLNRENILNSIDEIHSEHGIEASTSILKKQGLRQQGLNKDFSINIAKEKWAKLINNLIRAEDS